MPIIYVVWLYLPISIISLWLLIRSFIKALLPAVPLVKSKQKESELCLLLDGIHKKGKAYYLS